MSAPRIVPVPVESSLLVSVAYDAGCCNLQLEFCSGAVYQYFEVPPAIYNQLLAAGSKGGYFNDFIRDRFPYSQIRPPR